jgi:hypothetical protein
MTRSWCFFFTYADRHHACYDTTKMSVCVECVWLEILVSFVCCCGALCYRELSEHDVITPRASRAVLCSFQEEHVKLLSFNK